MERRRFYQAMVAKTDANNASKYLPLSMHSRDTAGMMRFLVENWLPDSVKDAIGVSRQELIRLAVFLGGVHDIGKASNAFMVQIATVFPTAYELLAPLRLSEPRLDNPRLKHHTVIGAAILNKEHAPDWVVSVVGAHHGKTLESPDFDDVMRQKQNLYGCAENMASWREAWQECLNEALAQAGYESLKDLPEALTQPAQILLTGLLIMADWRASNASLFPLIDADDAIDDRVYPARVEQALAKMRFLGKWEPDDTWRYEDLFGSRFNAAYRSNEVQQAIAQAAGEAEKPGLFILEAPMGVGKTEAALMAGEILANRQKEGGLAFFLPSQATANAMFDRVMAWIMHWTQEAPNWLAQEDTAGSEGQLTVELAHGKAALNEGFVRLTEAGASMDADGGKGISANAFFMGRKTQLLANFVVGTVDQLLMGALNQKHLMLRHLGLAGKTIVIDEVHAYDSYMERYLKGMLDWLGAYRTPVILLSATLPGKRRAELVGAYLGNDDFDGCDFLAQERAYPLLTWTDGEKVCTRRIDMPPRQTVISMTRGTDDDIVHFLKERLREGGCAGVIVNTVKRAQMLAMQLEQAFPKPAYEVLMDHAQFVMPDRIQKEKQLMMRLGKRSAALQRNGLIVVGTQVLEQSLDIDFDVMVSDLCPMDLLLQRLGRLHRHQEHARPAPVGQAACMVVGMEEIEPGAKAIYGEYLLEKTAALMPDVLRLPEDISRLVQDTYSENCEMLLHKKAGIEAMREEYNAEMAKKEDKAKRNCIPNPKRKMGRSKITRQIDGLMKMPTDMNELQAQATVRDGMASIEVLVLQYGKDEWLHAAVSGEEKLRISPDTMPSSEEAGIIMRQSLRLPYQFSLPGMLDTVIEELETVRQTKLREWVGSPQIGKELFLLLDRNGYAMLAGKSIKYDSTYGLQVEREDENGGKRI